MSTRRTFTFRLTVDEAEAARRAAEADHRTFAAWVRAAAFDAVGKAIDDGSRASRYDPMVGVALTTDERSKFEAEAERLGLSLAEWMRLAVIRRLPVQ